MARISNLGTVAVSAALVSALLAGCRGANAARPAEPPSKRDVGAQTVTHAVTVSGVERQYVTYRPRGYDRTRPTPLLIMYHGGGGTARHAMEETDWTRSAERYGFLAVFPEGIREHPRSRPSFSRNPQTWNDGSGRYYAGEIQADDVGFTRALIDDVSSKYNVDRRRIYVTGFSNGASMAFRIGVELSDRVAAIGPVAASGLRIANARMRRPVPLVYIHGTADPRNPLEGGDVPNAWVKGGIDRRPPLRDTVVQWAINCGCRPETTTLVDAAGVKGVAFTSCPDRVAVHFYTVNGLGHVWPGGTTSLPERLVGKPSSSLQANDTLWAFFQDHPLP